MKSRKLIAALICAVLFLASVFAIYSFAADSASDGLMFPKEPDSNYNYPSVTYQATKKLEHIPVTLEAMVLVPSSVGNDAVGPIFGNYFGTSSYGEAFINFEIYTNRNPRIWWGDEFGNGHYNIVFENTTVPKDTWTHVTFVYDSDTGVVSCYLNGELSEEKYFYPSLDEGVTDFPFFVGADQITMARDYFKGSLQDVAVFSDVRTAEEIRNDYVSVSYDEDNLLCYYDIDSSDTGKNIKDAVSLKYFVP